MSAKALWLFAVIVASLFCQSTAVNCNACRRRCKWYQVGCKAKKALCKLSTVPFATFTAGVRGVCAMDPSRMKARRLISDAKQILINRGLFSVSEFSGVKIRWCSALKVGGRSAGMAPSANLILLNTNRMRDCPEDLARLLAHEMIHIRQYRRWSTKGFQCRYSVQMVNGRGYGRRNKVEKEAYNYVRYRANHAIGPCR